MGTTRSVTFLLCEALRSVQQSNCWFQIYEEKLQKSALCLKHMLKWVLPNGLTEDMWQHSIHWWAHVWCNFPPDQVWIRTDSKNSLLPSTFCFLIHNTPPVFSPCCPTPARTRCPVLGTQRVWSLECHMTPHLGQDTEMEKVLSILILFILYKCIHVVVCIFIQWWKVNLLKYLFLFMPLHTSTPHYFTTLIWSD